MPIYRAWGEYGFNLGTLRAKDDPTAIERAKKKWPIHHKAGDIHLFNDALGYTFNLRREPHLPPHNPLVVPYNRNTEELEKYWYECITRVLCCILKVSVDFANNGDDHVVVTLENTAGERYPIVDFVCPHEGIRITDVLEKSLKRT